MTSATTPSGATSQQTTGHASVITEIVTPNPDPGNKEGVHTIRNAILCLALAAFASGMSMRVADPLLPELATEFSVSLGSASYVITVFSIAYGLAQLLFGPLGDRFGKYLVVAAVCAISVVTAILCALAPNFGLLLAARVLAGIAAAAVIPLSMAWIGDVIAYEDRQSVLARFLIGQILGLSSGVLLGGLAADYFPWQFIFVGIAVLFGVLSAILFSLDRKLPAYAKLTRRAEGNAVQRMVTEFREVLRKRWARTVLLSVFLEGASLYGAFAFIASHLHEVHKISLSLAGALLMLYGAGGFVYAMTSAMLVRRLGEVGLIRWGAAIVGGSLLLIALAPDWRWSIPGCFLTGVGFYMLHNTLQINATQMAPERRGAAVSSFAASFFLGQAVGVAGAGLLIDVISTDLMISIFSMGVVATGWYFARRKVAHLAAVE